MKGKRWLTGGMALVVAALVAACQPTTLDLPRVIFEGENARAEKVEPLPTIVPVEEEPRKLQETDIVQLNDVILRATLLDSQEIVVSGVSSVGKEYENYFTMLLVRADKVFMSDGKVKNGGVYKVIVAASSHHWPQGSRLLEKGQQGLLFCTALVSQGKDDVNSIADYMISQPQQLLLPLVEEGYVFTPLFRSFLLKANRYGDEKRVYVAPQQWFEETLVKFIQANPKK